MKRRSFIKNGIYTFAGASLLGGLYSWQIEPFWLEFVRLRMPVENLPPSLEGKTLMQISDIHVGNRFDHNYLIKSLKEAASFHPDFVVYTGDYISLHNDAVQYNKLEAVLAHAVKGKLGTVGILGNHDYGINWRQPEVADKITGIMEMHGIKMLRNEKTAVGGINFTGLDDYWGTNFNPQEVLASHDSSKASIVLCHNPDVCDLDCWSNYRGWILAGHTHGGQCKPPFLNAPMLPVKNKRYSQGKIDLHDGRMLYINRALGHLWQVRFNVRPEITIFELEKG